MEATFLDVAMDRMKREVFRLNREIDALPFDDAARDQLTAEMRGVIRAYDAVQTLRDGAEELETFAPPADLSIAMPDAQLDVYGHQPSQLLKHLKETAG